MKMMKKDVQEHPIKVANEKDDENDVQEHPIKVANPIDEEKSNSN